MILGTLLLKSNRDNFWNQEKIREKGSALPVGTLKAHASFHPNFVTGQLRVMPDAFVLFFFLKLFLNWCLFSLQERRELGNVVDSEPNEIKELVRCFFSRNFNMVPHMISSTPEITNPLSSQAWAMVLSKQSRADHWGEKTHYFKDLLTKSA